MTFLRPGVNRKVVDNVENYQNMKFQPKTWTRSRENGKKLPKTPNLETNREIIWIHIFFSKIGLRHFSTFRTG